VIEELDTPRVVVVAVKLAELTTIETEFDVLLP